MLPAAIKVRPNSSAAGVGGAVAVIIIWIISLFTSGPPPEVAAAIAACVSALSVECSAIVRNGKGTTAE